MPRRPEFVALPALIAASCLLAACDGARVTEVRVVHVAWPGRPVSDAMDREVIEDPAVRAALRGVAFERTTVDAAPREARDALGGFGTVAFVGGVLAGRHRGAASARTLARFVERVKRVSRGDGSPDARHWLDVGLPERALAALDVPGSDPRARLALRVEALLALGEVAAARRVLDAAAADARAVTAEAAVLLAERRARDAVRVLEAVEELSTEHAFWLGRALLECGERERAYAELERAARGDGPRADEAEDLLAAAITGGHGHSHR